MMIMSAASLDTSVPAMPMATLPIMNAMKDEGLKKNLPNIRLLQGWRVIDSVPSDCNYIASPLVALHNEQLLLGARPGKCDLLVAGDDLVQLLLCPVGHHVARDAGSSRLRVGGQWGVLLVDHWLIGDDPNLGGGGDIGVARNVDLLGDCLRCDWMVASHHDHLLAE